MVRDVHLTFSDEQALSIPAGAGELSDTNSTNEVPTTAGESGYTPAIGLVWKMLAREATGTPIQVEGVLKARLQYSLDGGSNWETDGEIEMIIARDHGTPDPALPASGTAEQAIVVGWDFAGLGEPPTDIRFRVVYSTDGREAGDGAATVNVSSWLEGPGGFSRV